MIETTPQVTRLGSRSAVDEPYCKPGPGSADTLTLGLHRAGTDPGLRHAKRGGRAVVLIDGRRVGVVSFDGQTRAPRFGRSRTWDGQSRGSHTVRLVMRNGAGCVDDVVVAGAARRP